MDKLAIENEARRIQVEIWSNRAVRYPLGVPGFATVFDPRNVADHLDLFFEVRDRIESDYAGGGEAAGAWRRDRQTILVSSRFPFETQRFTAGHEIGHFVLHPHVGGRSMHREFAVGRASGRRPTQEQEADYFSACLLMPRKAVAKEFDARFKCKIPLALTETVAYHLKLDLGVMFSQPRGSLVFAEAVARATKFDRIHFKSLAQEFGVSTHAMAIRLQELGLVASYLDD